MGVITQTRYNQVYTAGMTDVQTTMDVDAVPANSTGYLTVRRGYSDQEDIKYTGISGLQLTGLLRGLSPTALTDTEVLSLKQTHALSTTSSENTVEMTTIHYIINNKTDKDDDETITGAWDFTVSQSMHGIKGTGGSNQVVTFTEEGTPVNYFDLKASATGSQLKLSALGTDTNIGIELLGKGTGVVTIPDASTLKTNAAPTADEQIANKKYVDDQVATVATLTEASTADIAAGTQEIAGVRLYMNPKSTITEPSTYTPAYLTGGSSAEGNPAVWDSVSDASLRVTIDGTAYNIDAIDFTSAAGGDMDDMAAVIQAAIRVATSSTETCVWSTDHFVITSADTTSTTEILVLETSTGTVGTDISGAGASDWMDADTGNGTATAGVLDQTADVGKLGVLDATGRFDSLLMVLPDTVTSSTAELNKLDGASANVTAANLNTLTGGIGTPIVTVHAHKMTNGAFVWDLAANKTVAHGLGATPNWIRCHGSNQLGFGAASGIPFFSHGSKVGTSYACIYNAVEGGPTYPSRHATDAILYISSSGGTVVKITATSDGTNLTFATTSDIGACVIEWECGV